MRLSLLKTLTAVTLQTTTMAVVAADAVPADWLTAWRAPPAECRPLQIVHGVDLRAFVPDGIQKVLREKPLGEVIPGGLEYLRKVGLGGVVCNVAFEDYMRSEAKWKALALTIEACAELGLVVWIYDEDGYPSGAAGGLVIERDRSFEASALAHDPAHDPPFFVRPAYEHTHASNNFYAARRYPNLIDDRATRAFVDITHEAYWKRLEPHFGRTIRAMFTDEPSLIALDTGQLPEDVRRRVRVVDPLDPSVKALPSVPWCPDLSERYRERFGEDLLPHRASLFGGESATDRRVRRQFWSLVADLLSGRYFGRIQQWCRARRIASSGHSLWEERILHHVPLDGNGLKVLTRMDIPGLDLLSSDPEAVIHSGWLTAGMPASAAILTGGHRVMTEVSDFQQKMGGQGPVALDAMRATASWQATWGVTEFTLYYSVKDRSAEDYRAYCDHVGRLNAILRDARPMPDVLLYYPIHDLWEEYRPEGGPIRMENQTERARRLVSSFGRLGQWLQRSQVPFCNVDHEHLAKATPAGEGRVALGGRSFRALVVPDAAQLPPAAEEVAQKLASTGGTVVRDDAGEKRLSRDALLAKLAPTLRIQPPSDDIAIGRFERTGRPVLLLANVGREAYRGTLIAPDSATWATLDPQTGAVGTAPSREAGTAAIAVEARKALILVGTSRASSRFRG